MATENFAGWHTVSVEFALPRYLMDMHRGEYETVLRDQRRRHDYDLAAELMRQMDNGVDYTIQVGKWESSERDGDHIMWRKSIHFTEVLDGEGS